MTTRMQVWVVIVRIATAMIGIVGHVLGMMKKFLEIFGTVQIALITTFL